MSQGHDCVRLSTTPVVSPPPYTEFAAGPSSIPSSQTIRIPPPRLQPSSMPNRARSPGHPAIQAHHAEYGPTPLTSNQPLLPYAYYEARGSADARARSRFIRAILCASGLWLLVAFVVGVEVAGEGGWVWGDWVGRIWALDGNVRFWLWTRISNSGVEFAVA